MSVSKQSLMSRNPKKREINLKQVWMNGNLLGKGAKHRQMQILIYQVSTSMLRQWDSVVERVRRWHRKPDLIFSLGSNPGPRSYDFSPFPPLFFFFCHIQTFFYTNMNIFITLLDNVNKSRTSAGNLSLTATSAYRPRLSTILYLEIVSSYLFLSNLGLCFFLADHFPLLCLVNRWNWRWQS
jgi:hypothetical protein